MKKFLFGASILLSAFTSFGAGYQLNLQGLRELAMGGTGTAWPWDASTIFYNPGGLARLKGIQVYASGLMIMPSTAFGNSIINGSQPISTRTNAQTFTPFNFYVGGPIQENSKFALGLGIYTIAGIGLQWDNDWIGKYIIQNIQLQAICFQPTISYRINDYLSAGAGFVYGIGSLNLSNALPVHSYQGPNYDDGEAYLKGSANGVGFNLGLQIKASERLQFGVTYRSQVNMSVGGGTATFTVPQSLATSFPNQNFDSQLPLPQVASVGVGYRPVENLTLQFDLNFTGWNSFDSLRINFANQTSALKNEHIPMLYRNTLTPRIGANYKISRIISVMMGAAYDPTPVTSGNVSPILPDGNRAIVTCGASIKPLRGFTILAAIEGTTTAVHTGTDNYANFSGTYKTEAVTPGIGIYYNF